MFPISIISKNINTALLQESIEETILYLIMIILSNHYDADDYYNFLISDKPLPIKVKDITFKEFDDYRINNIKLWKIIDNELEVIFSDQENANNVKLILSECIMNNKLLNCIKYYILKYRFIGSYDSNLVESSFTTKYQAWMAKFQILEQGFETSQFF